MTRNSIAKLAIAITLAISISLQAKPDWFTQESEHFTIIYRQPQAGLVPHILHSAENALARLMPLFNYTPSEKIVIATFDFADYGTAGAISIPRNFIRLEIEPFELSYEFMPHHDRIQWLMNHELVHIVNNDQASGIESFNRSLFSKVAPEQGQPLSICFSRLTNNNRYTPRWHQEGIAVFLETWLSGGHGRVLGNFDEMYFRSAVLEKRELLRPDLIESRAKTSHLLGTLHYLYGTRFMSYLAMTYGVDRLLDWYRTQPDERYPSFDQKFERIFAAPLQEVWDNFLIAEQQFQQANLERLRAAKPTPVSRLLERPLGWVTQPFVDSTGTTVIFGNHQGHHLTALHRFDLRERTLQQIGTLPTPSMLQISSIAYDDRRDLLFFTTNNNSLYRDIHVQNLKTNKSRILFEDVRTGQLAVSSKTGELWGIRHAGGRAVLVHAAAPYKVLKPVIEFNYGEVLQHLAVSSTGRFLAATLHQSSGDQSVIVVDLERLKHTGRFRYETISEQGSPEFPSWSPDEHYLYWNAYTNGVSNIYRTRRDSLAIEPMSHTMRGLFRPVYVNRDSIFAFEFTSEGFIPVIIPNQPAVHLPAIEYFGQQVIAANPQVADWSTQDGRIRFNASPHRLGSRAYSGIANMKLLSFYPQISGFQNQTVIGLYTRLADPLGYHDLTVEAGFSPFGDHTEAPNFHFSGRYEFLRKYHLAVEHNAASFYDLFNQRKTGFSGTRFSIGQKRFLKFDQPHKITHTSELSIYKDVKAINDNLIEVTSPEFAVFETSISSSNVRRSIGSVDSEQGTEWEVTLNGIGSNPKKPQFAASLRAEWGRFQTWGAPHNVFRLGIAAGYALARQDFSLGRFYFGGFGNRLLESKPAKQYRDMFRFPGMPDYGIASDRFAKFTVENSLPPLRFDGLGIGSHALQHLEASLFSQLLVTGHGNDDLIANVGIQANLVFEHWFNLESTLSIGAVQAWQASGASRQLMVSFKLLKN